MMALTARPYLKGIGLASRYLLSTQLPAKCLSVTCQATQRDCHPCSDNSGIKQMVSRFSSLSLASSPGFITNNTALSKGNLCRPETVFSDQRRNKIRYSLKKGKAKSVKPVLNRFYRLDWGIWIRTRAGRHKRLWKKHAGKRYRYKQHVFCNRQQSKLLDKMVKTHSDHWIRPRHCPEDPYNAYQKRSNFDKYFVEKPKFIP